ncbi:hypothetical protein [Nitrososphaera sp. AFS]|jgi:hypothetical protein|uniref:hypothetical protein n=1 Tax=Nitrososphaera sp. AFS TaxID=2301191 RepID=UPI0013923A5A|nr:hypothetical protein [Nitrososphaera sp. AFS]NAL77080.1 hypothetical protein [Nitrososphaera sp. AFS]
MSIEPPNEDKAVYFGVININEGQKTIGAVDIWRSVITKELFCEEKRLGILEIADNIGMPKIEKDRKWAVAINRDRKGQDRWRLIKLINGGIFTFRDSNDSEILVDVAEHKIKDNQWWSFLVEKNVNRNIDITSEKDAK